MPSRYQSAGLSFYELFTPEMVVVVVVTAVVR
jgi:hypothetical protein